MNYQMSIRPVDQAPYQLELPNEIVELAKHLKYGHSKYFQFSDHTVLIDLNDVVLTRFRRHAVNNAICLMTKAAIGKTKRREAISLKPIQGDMYFVIDGNTTCIIAKAAGWKDIPANISQIDQLKCR